MKRVLPALLLMLATALPAMAATTIPVAGNVSITGDNFVVDDAKHQATFTGNVVVVQSQITVNADVVVASYGVAGASSIKSFEATGHVKLVTKQQTATGDHATFDPATKILRLTGNVMVVSPTGQVKSSDLVIDLKKNTSLFTAAKGGRVTGTFSAQ